MNAKRNLALAAVITALAATVLTACGSDSSSSSNSVNASNSFDLNGQPTSGQTCFTKLSPTDEASLRDYVAERNAEVVQSSADVNDVCVIDSSGNQRYYDRNNDSFMDGSTNLFLLYALMGHHSNSLATYGLLTGQMDIGEVLMLNYLAGIGPGGSLYRPYKYTDHGYARDQQPITYRVTNVYYGTKAVPVKYSDTLKPPAGYQYTPVKKPSDSEFDVNKGTVVPGVKASQVIAKSAAKTPTYTKSGQSVPVVTSVPTSSAPRSGSPSARPSSGTSSARPSNGATTKSSSGSRSTPKATATKARPKPPKR